MQKVNFLGIGAQKAATSWLWKNLNKHPEIWLPPRKELHYFDRNLKYPSPSFLATDSFFERLFSIKEHNILFKKKALKELSSIYKAKNFTQLKWYIKYYLSYYNDEWYDSLFINNENLIKGEITPAYSILDINDINNIKKLYPDLKIIFIMRNPIERAWSQIKFYRTRQIHTEKIEYSKLKEFIDSPMQELRGDYIGIIEKWSSVFDKEKMFIGFYDEIVNEPENFMHNVYKFLGVKNNYSLFFKEKINPSNKLKMDQEIYQHLYNKYYKEIKKLDNIYKKDFIKNWI